MSLREPLALLGPTSSNSLLLVHVPESLPRDRDDMLTLDQLSMPKQRIKAYPIKSLLGNEPRLEFWRDITRKVHGKVTEAVLD